MNCVVMAGGRPIPGDPLCDLTKGKPKACLQISGKSVLEWVLEALQNTKTLDKILVVGPDDLQMPASKKPLFRLLADENLLANGLAAVSWIQQNWDVNKHVLFCGGDIPAITGTIVDEFVHSCRSFKHAAYYPMVSQEDMELKFTGSKRTFVRLSDGSFAGGDMILAKPSLAESNPELLDILIRGRKHAWKIAWKVGFTTLFRFLSRRLTVRHLEETATRLIGQPTKIIVSRNAELAMDIDKPQHLAILREFLQ